MACIRTRVFKYVDFGENGLEQKVISEQEILNKYWKFWKDKIYTINTPNTRRIRDLTLSKQCDACIDDFLVVHWAEEIIDK